MLLPNSALSFPSVQTGMCPRMAEQVMKWGVSLRDYSCLAPQAAQLVVVVVGALAAGRKLSEDSLFLRETALLQ